MYTRLAQSFANDDMTKAMAPVLQDFIVTNLHKIRQQGNRRRHRRIGSHSQRLKCDIHVSLIEFCLCGALTVRNISWSNVTVKNGSTIFRNLKFASRFFFSKTKFFVYFFLRYEIRERQKMRRSQIRNVT